jgi:MYXO-CTERM domain-containing protein
VIPRDTAYNLRIDVRMDNPACTNGVDAALMPNLVRFHSDAAHRPRMDFAVTNPIQIEALHPQFVGDDLVVHASMNAAWGNYDIAEVNSYTPNVTAEDMVVGIDGATEAAGLYRYSIVQPTNPHYQHQNAVTVVYVWPYKADRATEGVYTVSLLVRNDQGTATATADATFELGRNVATVCDQKTCFEEGPGPADNDNQAPGPTAVLLGLALVGVAAALRRRS